MWSVHYRILLHKRAVNSSWGPAQEPGTQSPWSVWNYTELCMIKTWALPQDAQKFNQDIRPRWPTLQTRWLGAVTGGPWASQVPVGWQSRKLQGAVWGSLGAHARGNRERARVHTWWGDGGEGCAVQPGSQATHLGAKVIFSQLSSQAVLWDSFHRIACELVWL